MDAKNLCGVKETLLSWTQGKEIYQGLLKMLLRAWEVLELQVAGNDENIQQANIFVFPYSICFWLVWKMLYWTNPKLTLSESLSEDLRTERTEHPQYFLILLPSTLNKICPPGLQQQSHFCYLLRKGSWSQWRFWFAVYTFSKATFDMHLLYLQWAVKVLLISEEDFTYSWILLQISPLMVRSVDTVICLGAQV